LTFTGKNNHRHIMKKQSSITIDELLQEATKMFTELRLKFKQQFL